MTRQIDWDYFQKHQDPIPGAITLRGKDEGPHVLIIGGTHGNEPSGVKAILKFHQQLIEDPTIHTRGKITFLLANPEAYLEDKRYLEYDLNRSFTDEIKENAEGRRALTIRDFLKKIAPIDRVLDIHSVSKDDSQIMVYNAKQPHSRELAQSISNISTHLAFHSEHIEGLLIEECGKYGGATSLVVECGNHTDPHSEIVAFYHIYRFLQYYGLILPNPKWDTEKEFLQTADHITYYETITSIKPEGDFTFLRDDLETGSFFRNGSTFAKNESREFQAPEDCYIVMPPSKINPNDHDAGFLCTRQVLKV